MKCEKCEKSEATVFYTVISGKFKATRKRYCKTCMESERIRTSVPPPQKVNPQQPQSLLDLAQGELAKKDSKPADVKADKPQDKTIKGLELKMKMAIGEERYEDAARIRDEITSLSKAAPEAPKPSEKTVEKPVEKPAKPAKPAKSGKDKSKA